MRDWLVRSTENILKNVGIVDVLEQLPYLGFKQYTQTRTPSPTGLRFRLCRRGQSHSSLDNREVAVVLHSSVTCMGT